MNDWSQEFGVRSVNLLSSATILYESIVLLSLKVWGRWGFPCQ